MKAPRKSIKKTAVKTKPQEIDNAKKPKLKPISSKEVKNWKNKIEEEEDGDMQMEEMDDFGQPHSFDDEYEEDDDRY